MANQHEKKLMQQMQKAIREYNMIQPGDRVMVCLSGGKDSFTLLKLLNSLRIKMDRQFSLFSYTLDQSQPGWDDSALKQWLADHDIPSEVETQDTYSIVKEKVPAHKTYCALCSRLRRGIIYNYAKKNNFNKIALGHHRDDLIESLLMSMFYNGKISSMPPKLLTDDKKNVVIRPLVFCSEKDIYHYAMEQQFPIIPCSLCGTQENLARQRTKALIHNLANENENIPSNLLKSLQSLQPSQLMDKLHWDFESLNSENHTNTTHLPEKGHQSINEC
mgnify:CR=1 FL=1